MIDNKTIREVVIADKLFPGASGEPTYEDRTATGAVATFETNVAMALNSCHCIINPLQEGSGDPSPENPRNIVGFSSLTVTRSTSATDRDFTINLGRTVYGGSADVVGGEGEETWGVIDLSTIQWSITSNRAIITELRGIIKPPLNNYVPSEAIAEKYSAIAWAESLNDNQTSYGVASDGTVVFYYDGTTPTGLFVYPLATPTDFTFTGQEIKTVVGEQTFLHDCNGNIEVSYKYQTGTGTTSKVNKWLPIFYPIRKETPS